MNFHHLTNAELISQLTLRNDLTPLEHELLDRLIRAQAELERDQYVTLREPVKQ